MPFAYDYSHMAATAGKTKKIIVAAVAVILVLSVYVTATTLSGRITMPGITESEYNKTKKDLEIYRSIGEECTKDLWVKEQNLTLCENKFDSAYTSINDCNQQIRSAINSPSSNASLQSCPPEVRLLFSSYGNLTASYSNIVRGSVKAVCCSYGDAMSSSVRNWGVTPEGIVCYGPSGVNCSNGEIF